MSYPKQLIDGMIDMLARHGFCATRNMGKYRLDIADGGGFETTLDYETVVIHPSQVLLDIVRGRQNERYCVAQRTVKVAVAADTPSVVLTPGMLANGYAPDPYVPPYGDINVEWPLWPLTPGENTVDLGVPWHRQWEIIFDKELGLPGPYSPAGGRTCELIDEGEPASALGDLPDYRPPRAAIVCDHGWDD